MTATIVDITTILVGPILPSDRRTDSPARWQAALERAHDGVELFVAPDGAFFASSRRDPARLYEVTATQCGCQAALSGDPVCCHRAAVRSALWVQPFGGLTPA